jgi:hypothetical protein
MINGINDSTQNTTSFIAGEVIADKGKNNGFQRNDFL